MLNNYAYIFALGISVAVLTYVFLLYYKKAYKKKSSVINDKNKSKKTTISARKAPVLSIANRQKLRTQTRMECIEPTTDKNDEIDEKVENTDKKIGVKKARKLEEKKLKKEQREIEEREKEIRKKQDEENAAKEKIIKEQEEKIALEQEAKLEMERKEKERQELELYEQLKLDFSIEDEGNENESDIINVEKKLNEDIIDYLMGHKVVMVEELSGHFNIKTQAKLVCVDKIKEFLKSEQVSGVIDDRGKFIHITPQEYATVAKFIIQRGRIHIKELVENSNKLIKLY